MATWNNASPAVRGGERPQALARPDDTFIDLYVAYLNAPTIGRAIPGDAGHADLMRRLEPASTPGGWPAPGAMPTTSTRASPAAPSRLALPSVRRRTSRAARSGSLARPRITPPLNAALVLRVPHVGRRSGQPGALRTHLTRAKGSMLPVITQRSASLDYQAPEALFHRPAAPSPTG